MRSAAGSDGGRCNGGVAIILGVTVENEHVLIHGWPVQILPAYTPLVEAAVSDAKPQTFEGLTVSVVTVDYLCAIALQTGLPKDYQRVSTR